MAKSKRPQASTSLTAHAGAAEPQVSASVQGVDTFVQPGNVGMPQAPVPIAKPEAFGGSQAAQDLQKLGTAFHGLSASLGNLAQSERKGDKSMYEWAAELAILKNEMDKTGEDLASKVSAGQIEALEHPAAAKGLSDGVGIARAYDNASNITAEIEQWKSDPHAMDIDKMMNRWDTTMQEARGKGPNARTEAFETSYMMATAKHRAKFESTWRTYVSNKTIETVEGGLKSSTATLVDLMMQDPTEAFRTLNPQAFKALFKKAGEEEIDWDTESTSALTEQLLKGYKGSVIGLNRAKELMGRHLIDLAMNADNPETARMALRLLNDFDSGPADNKVKILADKSVPDVKNYYDLHKDAIASKLHTFDKAAVNKAFRQTIESTRINIVDSLAQQIRTHPGKTNSYSLVYSLVGDREDGATVEAEGYSIKRTGFNIKFENYHGQSVTLNVEELYKLAENRVFEEAVKSKLTTPSVEPVSTEEVSSDIEADIESMPTAEVKSKKAAVSESAAHAAAAIETGTISPLLQESVTNLYEGTDHVRKEGFSDESGKYAKQWETDALAVIEAMEVYMKPENLPLLHKQFPNKEARVFAMTLYSLYSDPKFLDFNLKGDISKLRQFVIDKDAVKGADIDGFNEHWDDNIGKGATYLTDEINKAQGVGINLSDLEQVKMHARMLYWYGGGDFLNVDTAIKHAVDTFTGSLVEVRGKKYLPGDVRNPNIENMRVPIGVKLRNPDFIESFSSLVGPLFSPFTGQDITSAPVRQIAAKAFELDIREALGRCGFGHDEGNWFDRIILPFLSPIDDLWSTEGHQRATTREEHFGGLIKGFTPKQRQMFEAYNTAVHEAAWKATYDDGMEHPTVKQILDEGLHSLKTSPPPDFVITEQRPDVTITDWELLPNQSHDTIEMMFWRLTGTQEGNPIPVDMGTYSITEIANLTQWANPELKDKFRPVGERIHDVLVTEVDTGFQDALGDWVGGWNLLFGDDSFMPGDKERSKAQPWYEKPADIRRGNVFTPEEVAAMTADEATTALKDITERINRGGHDSKEKYILMQDASTLRDYLEEGKFPVELMGPLPETEDSQRLLNIEELYGKQINDFTRDEVTRALEDLYSALPPGTLLDWKRGVPPSNEEEARLQAQIQMLIDHESKWSDN